MSNAATAIAKAAQRNANGTWPKGVSGRTGHDAGRARRALNRDTIEAMHAAFREHGKAAIEKVILSQPAVFLKLLVLLVPRELEVTHSQGVKGMSDEQIEAAIEAIQEMLARRSGGEDAKVIEAIPEKLEDSQEVKTPKVRRKRGRTMGTDMGSADSDSNTIDGSSG